MEYWTLQMEKQVCQRVQIVLTDPALLSVMTKFGGEPFRRSSVFHGLGQFLAENDVRGSRCFEIGTWNGLTAVVLSRFFDEVVSVDIAHNPERAQIIDHLGIKNIRCIDIRDNHHKAMVAKGLDFDCAYVDGNHAEDTQSDWAITRRCGRVIFHECWPFQKPVFDLVQSLPPHEVVYGGAGLAMWTR